MLRGQCKTRGGTWNLHSYFFFASANLFSTYTVQTLKRIRGDLAAEGVARAGMQ